jgi:hypothetical protein
LLLASLITRIVVNWRPVATTQKNDLMGDGEEVGGVYVFPAVLFFTFGGLATC